MMTPALANAVTHAKKMSRGFLGRGNAMEGSGISEASAHFGAGVERGISEISWLFWFIVEASSIELPNDKAHPRRPLVKRSVTRNSNAAAVGCSDWFAADHLRHFRTII
jgi:hypothetical protein